MQNRNLKKYRIYLLFPLSLVLFWQCAYYNTLFNAKNNFDDGIEIIQKEPEKDTHPEANKYFDKTIEKCWKLIEIYSDKSKYADDALLYIVKSEFYLQKYPQAELHVNQFLQKYPNSEFIPEAYLWKGKIKLALKDEDAGKEFLYKSLNIAKKSKIKAEANYELGNIAFENNNFEQAVPFFEKALHESIDDQYAAFIQYYLGESYFQENQYKEAISRFKKVEKFSPSLDVEYKTKYHYAVSYSNIKQYDEALTILRKMLTAPRFKKFIPYIKSEIANINFQEKRVQEAIDLYREVVRDKVPGEGTALASYNLALIFENDIQDVDSAVYYYSLVKKYDSKFDSVKISEQKRIFLSELKQIRDDIKRDKFLVFRLENDRNFRDSLYTAQYDDSIKQVMKKLYGDQESNKEPRVFTNLFEDTTSQAYRDSLKKVEQDSLAKVREDSLDNLANNKKEEDNWEENFRKSTLESQKDNENQTADNKKDKTEELANKDEKVIEKRKLPQIKEDLKKNRYHLAEYFLLKVENYDSALYYYKTFLGTYEDSVLTPKAIYSLYYIYSSPGYQDSVRMDSLGQVLENQYPNSQFAEELQKRKGTLQIQEEKDSLELMGKKLFLQAEKLYDLNQLDSALAVYRRVANLDSTMEWSAKAQLAIAWIYENKYNDYSDAITAYTALKNDFPTQRQYVAFAEKKLAPPSTESVEKSDGVLTNANDSQEGEKPPQLENVVDTSSSENAESNATATDDSGSKEVTKTKKYIDWRRRRSGN